MKIWFLSMLAEGEFEPASFAQPIQVELSQHQQSLAQIQGAALIKHKFSITYGIDKKMFKDSCLNELFKKKLQKQTFFLFFLLAFLLHAFVFLFFQISLFKKEILSNERFIQLKLVRLSPEKKTMEESFEELQFLKEIDPSVGFLNTSYSSFLGPLSNNKNHLIEKMIPHKNRFRIDLDYKTIPNLSYHVSGNLAGLKLQRAPEILLMNVTPKQSLITYDFFLNVEVLGENGKIIFYEIENAVSKKAIPYLEKLLPAFQFETIKDEPFISGSIEISLQIVIGT